MEPANHVFISYAHGDPAEYVDEVQRQLRISLKNLAGFEVWTDDRIGIAEDWDREIRQALDCSACAILLISSRFLDSEYIYEKELPVLLCRAKDEALGLIPLFVSRVPKRSLSVEFPYHGGTEHFDLASAQGVNGPDKPLDGVSGSERMALLASLADRVAKWLEQRAPPSTGPAADIRRPSAPPPVAPSDHRPELTVELQRWQGQLRRRFYFNGGVRPIELDTPETDAEHELKLWEPCLSFESEALSGLLLGEDPSAWTDLLTAAAGQEARDGVALTRYPFRVRLLAEGSDLVKLPWASLSYQGTPLRQSGWTLELSPQPYPDQCPQFPNHSFSMPGPVLLVFSRDIYRKGHLDDLHGLFNHLWPKRRAVFEATDLDQLALDLRERSPRLLYYYGSGRWDRSTRTYLLEMPAPGGGRTELGIAELAQHFGARAPQVCFFNLVDEEGCNAMTDAAALLDHSKAVVLSCTSTHELGQAAEIGYRWLEHLLVHRSDPVIAFHHSGTRCGGCWTAYQEWRTESGGSLDDDLVEYFLDRHEQSEHLLGAFGELVNRESPMRVQFRLAIGGRGNRVLDFARQAELYLAENAFAGTYTYARGPVRVFGETTSTAAVETAFRRALQLAPRADLFEALRTKAPAFGGEILVPLLVWRLEGDDEPSIEAMKAVAQAVLEWSWEHLAIGCPEDLRVVSLLLMETPSHEEAETVQSSLRAHERGLRDRGGTRASFKYRAMSPLSAVDEDHLRDYFESPICWCWDHLREEYPALMLNGRSEMPFDEAVRLVKRAKAMGWGKMAEKLRRTREKP
jgi:hypothetical protein